MLRNFSSVFSLTWVSANIDSNKSTIMAGGVDKYKALAFQGSW